MADDASGSGAAGGETNARPLEGSAMTRIIVSYPVLSAGFIAVREMSGRNKISQGQGIVREFYKVSGKFWHMAKLMKNVMEFHIMSGKVTILDNITLQSPRISTN